MKEKILNNCRIIDPSQKLDEIGNILIDQKGKIKDIGKKVKIPNKNEIILLSKCDLVDNALKKKRISLIKKITSSEIFCISSHTLFGIEDLKSYIRNKLV